ncbi:OmpH family outer membrane protein [Thermodesulfobacteriota bacterium]
MRKLKARYIGVVLFLVLWMTPSFGADVAKIGVVDFQKIMETSSAGKASQAAINKQGKKMETDLKQQQAELQGLKQKLDREAMVMSKEMRDEKEREFRIRINDFKSLEKKYKQQLAVLNKTLVKRMQDDIFQLVQELGRNEGYLMIVEKLEGGVIYLPETINITDKVIKLYNEKFAQGTTGVKAEQ